jgi:8-oxo-dGTP diphosphatase
MDSARHSYKHPHPAVAVDLAIFTLRECRAHVLLIERGREPFKGKWALPGGFVRIDEDLIEAAYRELSEETGVSDAYLEQIGAFGAPARDPRERVISIGYFAVLASNALEVRAGGDAAVAQWWPLKRLPALAFDHAEILARARHALTQKLTATEIALLFLPAEFTLTELQQVHEAILGEPLDKRNFRKWAAGQPYLKSTGRMRSGAAHRPAALYRARAGSAGARSRAAS